MIWHSAHKILLDSPYIISSMQSSHLLGIIGYSASFLQSNNFPSPFWQLISISDGWASKRMFAGSLSARYLLGDSLTQRCIEKRQVRHTVWTLDGPWHRWEISIADLCRFCRYLKNVSPPKCQWGLPLLWNLQRIWLLQCHEDKIIIKETEDMFTTYNQFQVRMYLPTVTLSGCVPWNHDMVFGFESPAASSICHQDLQAAAVMRWSLLAGTWLASCFFVHFFWCDHGWTCLSFLCPLLHEIIGG